jgi:hypothetical protein
MENAMTNFAGAQTQAKKFANQNDPSSDVQEVRENIKDLGDSVGHMASRQYDPLPVSVSALALVSY